MVIKPLKQQTEFGCFAACYAMIKNDFFGDEPFDKEIESELCRRAFGFETGANEHFYLIDLFKRGCSINVMMESPFLIDYYKNLSKLNYTIPIEYRLIGISDFEKALDSGYVIVTVLDRWDLDMYLHFPHYVIVETHDAGSLGVVDPQKGRIRIAKDRFLLMLENVKEKLGYSPIIFAFKK